MARVIYDQDYYIVLRCEECGIMQGSTNAEYFREGGHLVDFQEIRTPAEAKKAQRVHQKWHDTEEPYHRHSGQLWKRLETLSKRGGYRMTPRHPTTLDGICTWGTFKGKTNSRTQQPDSI